MNRKKNLSVENLKTHFKNKKEITKAVDGISFDIYEGETIALVGESGSGKSISSLSIMDLLPSNAEITSGSVYFDGKNLLNLSKKEINKIRGNDLSMIFQDPVVSLNPSIKIKNQIVESALHHNIIDKKDANNEVIRLLKLVGFKKPELTMNQFPHELSGGMKQRVMIASSLSSNPKLLIADEPTTSLDVSTQKQVLSLIDSYKSKSNCSVLLITHDLGVVSEYADRVMVMYKGRIVESADVYTIFENPIHPYTKGLLNSIPKVGDEKERLNTINDFLNKETVFKGKEFAPNFNSNSSNIYESKNDLIEIEKGHWVRFFI